MFKQKICFIAQFPPPIHGLSKAVDTLYNSRLREKFSFVRIDTTNNKRFLYNLFLALKSDSDLYYITIAQTLLGNIRDLVFIYMIKRRNKKVLIHLHGGYYGIMIKNDCSKLQRKFNYNVMRKVDGAIVLGESLIFNFEQLIKPGRIHIVPNCVDDEFLIDDIVFEKKIANVYKKECLNIVYLSNFIESKGYKDVLELAKLSLKQGIKHYKFTFAGKFFDKDSENYFFNFIKENNLDSIITYVGVVSGQEKIQLLNDGDIFILLTRYEKEGQPISIIEAMGNGLNVITTNHAGIPDLIDNNENGFLENFQDHEHILDTIERIYKNRDNHVQILRNNRKKVKCYYNEGDYINNMENVFSRVLNERKY